MTNRTVQPPQRIPVAPRWSRRFRACLLAAIPAIAVSLPATASAQGWLADRRYAEGEGIKAGDFELHPGIGGEVGYDSNWFYRSSKTGADLINGAPAAPPVGAAVLRVTPSFYLSTLGPQRMEMEPRTVTFRGGVSATGNVLIGDGVGNQSNIGVNADARLGINENHPLGFNVFAGYTRTIQPQVLANPDNSFNRSDVRVGGEIVAVPGGGAFDVRAGYQLAAALFEDSIAVPYTSLTHTVSLRNRWRFRPRTALFSDTTLSFINYPDAARALNYLNNSTPVRTKVGLNGLLTDRFGLLAAVGYGGTFFANPNAATTQQYDSVIGQLEGTYYLGQGPAPDSPGQASLLLSTIALGFTRDFQTSLLANVGESDKLYARVEYWFGGRVLVRFDAFGEQLDYPSAFVNNGTGTPVQVASKFTNYRVGGGVFGEYRFTSAFAINTTINYAQQFSNTQIRETTNGPQQVFDLNYSRFQAFLGARVFF